MDLSFKKSWKKHSAESTHITYDLTVWQTGDNQRTRLLLRFPCQQRNCPSAHPSLSLATIPSDGYSGGYSAPPWRVGGAGRRSARTPTSRPSRRSGRSHLAPAAARGASSATAFRVRACRGTGAGAAGGASTRRSGRFWSRARRTCRHERCS